MCPKSLSFSAPAALIFSAAAFVSLSAPVSASGVPIARFSQNDLSGWESQGLFSETDYQLLSQDGEIRLQAITDNSASGLVKKQTIDLTETPWMNWSWRSDHCYDGINERTKAGDDYPVRLYVIHAASKLIWKARALNYAWACNQAPGSDWPSAYHDGKSWLVAVETGRDNLGQWRQYRRNVREDLARYLDLDVSEIHGVALMSDSDNGNGHAQAWYGDIWFSAE